MLLYHGRVGFAKACRCTQACLNRFQPPRRRSVASAAGPDAWKHDSVELPIGISGRVQLDVFSAHERHERLNEPRNLLVYLPPGPCHAVGATSSLLRSTVSQLQNVLPPSTSLVRINYSLAKSANAPSTSNDLAVFPTPIHEVTTAFDYLTSSTSAFNADHDEAPKICLLGRHIGGALATMLALTEPNAIHALAVAEPVVDWVGLDEALEQLRAVAATRSLTSSSKMHAQKQARKQARAAKSLDLRDQDAPSLVAAAEELVKLRSKLFNTPSAYFDPFASPILFLRAPGRDTPLATTAGDQLLGEMSLNDTGGQGEVVDHDGDDPQQSSPSSVATSADTSDSSSGDTFANVENGAATPETPAMSPRRRKVLRRWPAVDPPESVTLPHVRVFVQSHVAGEGGNAVDIARGHAALMRAQGTEMAELMRRACFLGREKGFADERVQLSLCDPPSPGVMVIGGGMHEAAMKWVGEMFDKD
ncbi:hypothetical protein PV04_03032 [Phialophora macrospora]|uniref:Uncharacterized protein n=1 Tax=Phialophora macrospora TaxID=1851006 RepID=A0A0D2E900_9EURO|nr:hypothetical protein PV04_03032 [Phialophora macrospora]